MLYAFVVCMLRHGVYADNVAAQDKGASHTGRCKSVAGGVIGPGLFGRVPMFRRLPFKWRDCLGVPINRG